MSFNYQCEQFYFRVTSDFEFSSEIRVQCQQLMCYKVQVDHGLSIKDAYRYDQEAICRYFGTFALNIGLLRKFFVLIIRASPFMFFIKSTCVFKNRLIINVNNSVE